MSQPHSEPGSPVSGAAGALGASHSTGPNIFPASQDLQAHLGEPPTSSQQAAAGAELAAVTAAPAAVNTEHRPLRSHLVLSQETALCESAGHMEPTVPAIDPTAALRVSTRKRSSTAAADETMDAAQVLEQLRGVTDVNQLSRGQQPSQQLLPIAPLGGLYDGSYMKEVKALAAQGEVPPATFQYNAKHINSLLQLQQHSQLLQLQQHSQLRQQYYSDRDYQDGQEGGYSDQDDIVVPHPPNLHRQIARRRGGLSKPEHANSVAKRRGPMDEMRQLMRILVQVIPAAAEYMGGGDEATSNNKVKEKDIHTFLRHVLGTEPPYPEWGLPENGQHVGWGGYLAALFTWATNTRVTKDQAMKCAQRQQGRRWEACYDKLRELGVYSYNWQVPLRREGVRLAPPDIPPHLLRDEERGPVVEEPLAEAVMAAATAACGHVPANILAASGMPLGARRPSSTKAKRQRTGSAPQEIALPPPQSAEELERYMQLPMAEQWKVVTMFLLNISKQIDAGAALPNSIESREEWYAEKAWEEAQRARARRDGQRAAAAAGDMSGGPAGQPAAAAAAVASLGRGMGLGPVTVVNSEQLTGVPVLYAGAGQQPSRELMQLLGSPHGAELSKAMATLARAQMDVEGCPPLPRDDGAEIGDYMGTEVSGGLAALAASAPMGVGAAAWKDGYISWPQSSGAPPAAAVAAAEDMAAGDAGAGYAGRGGQAGGRGRAPQASSVGSKAELMRNQLHRMIDNAAH